MSRQIQDRPGPSLLLQLALIKRLVTLALRSSTGVSLVQPHGSPTQLIGHGRASRAKAQPTKKARKRKRSIYLQRQKRLRSTSWRIVRDFGSIASVVSFRVRPVSTGGSLRDNLPLAFHQSEECTKPPTLFRDWEASFLSLNFSRSQAPPGNASTRGLRPAHA